LESAQLPDSFLREVVGALRLFLKVANPDSAPICRNEFPYSIRDIRLEVFGQSQERHVVASHLKHLRNPTSRRARRAPAAGLVRVVLAWLDVGGRRGTGGS